MTIRTLTATALLALVVAACGGGASTTPPKPVSAAPAASASTAPAPASGPAAANTTAITVKDFTLEPKDLTVVASGALAVTNAGPTVHNVAVRDASGSVVATTKDLRAGEQETLVLPLPAGSYILFCSLAGHESLGVKGTLTVTK